MSNDYDQGHLLPKTIARNWVKTMEKDYLKRQNGIFQICRESRGVWKGDKLKTAARKKGEKKRQKHSQTNSDD